VIDVISAVLAALDWIIESVLAAFHQATITDAWQRAIRRGEAVA
jgi:hypothetical protein